MVSFGRPYASRICSIFLLWMELKALGKSTNSIVARRSFAPTPLRILRIVNIFEVVDLFQRKPFWFFRRILSMLASMRFRSRVLYILAVMDVTVISRQFLANLRSLFLGKGGCIPSSICQSDFDYKLYYNVGAVCHRIVWFPYIWGNFIKPGGFSIFNFSKYWVEFF